MWCGCSSGIAGPPEYENFGAAADWTNTRLTNATSYSRLTIERHSLHFEQVGQDNGSVIDDFTLTRTKTEKKKPPPRIVYAGCKCVGLQSLVRMSDSYGVWVQTSRRTWQI